MDARSLQSGHNAAMESYWGSLKTELVLHQRFATREQMRNEISEYIAIFYNRIPTKHTYVKIHSVINWHSVCLIFSVHLLNRQTYMEKL